MQVIDVDRSGKIEATDASLVLMYYAAISSKHYKKGILDFLREEAGVDI